MMAGKLRKMTPDQVMEAVKLYDKGATIGDIL